MICKYLKETLGIYTVKNDLFLHVSAVKKIVKKETQGLRENTFHIFKLSYVRIL